jgi:hypothetical protein
MSQVLQPVVNLVGPDPMIGIADPLQPFYLFGLEPVMWGLAVSAVMAKKSGCS